MHKLFEDKKRHLYCNQKKKKQRHVLIHPHTAQH